MPTLRMVRRPNARWTAMVTAVASRAYHAPCASLAMVPCRAVTARIARMPTGIDTDSFCTTAEPRSRPRTAKGRARSARVMAKTIARTAIRYEVLGIGGFLGGAAGGDGDGSPPARAERTAGEEQQQADEQQQRGEHGRPRCQDQGDGHACAGQQDRDDL